MNLLTKIGPSKPVRIAALERGTHGKDKSVSQRAKFKAVYGFSHTNDNLEQARYEWINKLQSSRQ